MNDPVQTHHDDGDDAESGVPDLVPDAVNETERRYGEDESPA